jgi:hypothetical protein
LWGFSNQGIVPQYNFARRRLQASHCSIISKVASLHLCCDIGPCSIPFGYLHLFLIGGKVILP